MPKEGWVSISIQEETINDWKTKYDQNKEFCKHRGITSFTGFINSIMSGIMSDSELLKKSIIESSRREAKNFVST